MHRLPLTALLLAVPASAFAGGDLQTRPAPTIEEAPASKPEVDVWLCIQDLGPKVGNNEIRVENGTLRWNQGRCELTFKATENQSSTIPMSRMDSVQGQNSRVTISGDKVVTNYSGTIDRGNTSSATIDFTDDRAAINCLTMIMNECSK